MIDPIFLGGHVASHPKHPTGTGRGGRQPGAGRPRGSQNKRQAVQIETLAAGRKLPLEIMLDIINDPKASEERRDRFVIAAAPYLHPRLTAVAEPKALFEMTTEELRLVMHRQMRHAEEQGNLEEAEQLRQWLYEKKEPTGAASQGNGATKPV